MDYEKAYNDVMTRLHSMVAVQPEITKNAIIGVFPELAESEDEKIRKEITSFFKNFNETGTWKAIADVAKWIAWLEKQGEQKNVEKHSCKCIHVGCHVNNCRRWCHSYQKEVSYELCNELCERFANEQKPVEWSEEDDIAINDLMWCIEAYRKNAFNHTHTERADRAEKWLKSLSSQSHWKPSEEQMGALNYAYCELFKRGENGEGHRCVHPLMTLIDNLKAL